MKLKWVATMGLVSVGAFGLSPGVGRREAVMSVVTLVPGVAVASGATPEEAVRRYKSTLNIKLRAQAKYAEKYRSKGNVCTPTHPENCTEQYGKMLDPRKGLSAEELAKRDARDQAELASLRAMLKP